MYSPIRHHSQPTVKDFESDYDGLPLSELVFAKEMTRKAEQVFDDEQKAYLQLWTDKNFPENSGDLLYDQYRVWKHMRDLKIMMEHDVGIQFNQGSDLHTSYNPSPDTRIVPRALLVLDY